MQFISTTNQSSPSYRVDKFIPVLCEMLFQNLLIKNELFVSLFQLTIHPNHRFALTVKFTLLLK